MVIKPLKLCKDLSLKTATGYIFLHFDDIIRIESIHNCALVYTRHFTEPIKVIHTLDTIQRKVHGCNTFFRCHRSHIVNLKYLNQYIKKGRVLVMERGEVPIAKPYMKEFEEFICI